MPSNESRCGCHLAMLGVFIVVFRHDVGSFYKIARQFITPRLSRVWISAQLERKEVGVIKVKVFLFV